MAGTVTTKPPAPFVPAVPAPPKPAAPAAPAAPVLPAFTSDEADAWAQLQATLASYGFTGTDLSFLVDFARKELINGVGQTQILLDLEQTHQFEQRFPAITLRLQQGLPPISPAEYISLEASYEQLEQSAGLVPNMASYDELIAHDVSPTEYADRINQGYLAVQQSDPTVRQAFQDYYGVTPGQLVSYFLDPTKAEPVLVKQAVASQIGGAAAQSGFGEPTSSQAMRLAQMNVTFAQAQQGFQKLQEQRQLYEPLPGQGQSAADNLTSDQLLNATFGSDAASAQALTLAGEQQKAAFSGGGQTAETSSGITGLGALQR
jgi:hypothetical protein